MDFVELGLDERLLKGIETAGYVNCTPVQEQVIKASQDGADLYVQSQTGTGKTAAYLVAVINEMITKEENKGRKCLVLVPTRELAVQVEEEAKVLVGTSGLKAFSVYGGVGYEKQIAALKKGVDIVIGTPGRVIDLQEGGNLDLKNSGFCIIDEADRMFDMGFYDDLRKILKCLPEAEKRQTMLFSATLNTYVKNLAWEYTRDPVEITIEAENITVSEIDQELLHVSSDEKMKLLIGILKHENPASAIVFCNTKRTCEVVSKRLCMNDIKSDFLIGDLPQSRRLQLIKAFKAGDVKILVATDVAARGIDVDDLAMVINYDLPVEAENYVHRIGRTARAGKTGKAYTFCSEQDVYNLPAIERYIEMNIPATVAYPEQMEEDKSAGVYIKTENWRGDDDYSHDRRNGGRGHHGNDGRNHKAHNNHNNNSYGKKAGEYKKDGYKKSGDYKKGRKGNGKDSYQKKPFIDPDKLAGLSYDERMKLYKETYASSVNAAPVSSDSKNKKSGKQGNNSNNRKDYNKSESGNFNNGNRHNNKDSNGYKKSGNSNHPKNGSYSRDGHNNKNGNKNKSYNNTKNNNKKSAAVQANIQKAPEKKGLFAKIKSLFSKGR